MSVDCLGKYVERLRGAEKKIETFPCPTCRSEFTLKSNQDVAELPSSYFIKNMLEIMAIQQKAKTSTACSRCQDPAINHCASCQIFMCKKCSGLHDTWPANKNHNTLSVQELSNPESQKVAEGKEALNNICEVMKSLEKNAKTVKDQIQEQKENILKIVAEKLDERAKKMNEDVDQAYGELHSELSEQHDEMKDYLDKVQASVSLPRNLLKRGSIEEIISSQKLIDEKIERLRNDRPENFAAVNDGGIWYVPDDIGNINVDEIVDKLGHVEDPCIFPFCDRRCFGDWIHIRQRVRVCTDNHLKSKEAGLGDKCHRLLLTGSCIQEGQQIEWSCGQVGIFLR
ncbi:Hypothetical predicted protein [Paramuricea clavata]|uniref:Uncharacterized protein n=1 Tax=Paramuricea clavata TaxID=317549 RepID=A0A6S7J4N3_PARCT|nr:Hypothetical predicted protein [Paramuricea clavata]